MTYTLKLFDKSLLEFVVVENLADPIVNITWLDDSHKDLLP